MVRCSIGAGRYGSQFGGSMTFTADTLILFGATGDLAQRMLLPSLCALDADQLLPENLRIVGTARSAMSDGEFRNFARAAVEKYMPTERRGHMADFLNRLSYQANDVTTPEGFAELASRFGGPDQKLAIFLSTAPSLFGTTIEGLREAGLTAGDVRIGLESRSAPISPRAAGSTTRLPPPSPRSASSASTTTSARRRCRT